MLRGIFYLARISHGALLLLYPVGHPDVTVLLQLGAVAGLV